VEAESLPTCKPNGELLSRSLLQRASPPGLRHPTQHIQTDGPLVFPPFPVTPPFLHAPRNDSLPGLFVVGDSQRGRFSPPNSLFCRAFSSLSTRPTPSGAKLNGRMVRLQSYFYPLSVRTQPLLFQRDRRRDRQQSHPSLQELMEHPRQARFQSIPLAFFFLKFSSPCPVPRILDA